MFYTPALSKLNSGLISVLGSGTNVPTTGDCVYYKTDTNILAYYSNGTLQYSRSFPLAVFTVYNNTVTSIDQVFNGFSYIGSTVFALPGVKGLIPNGRNADGSLKSIEVSVSSVKLLTLSSSITVNGNGRFLLNSSGGIFARVGTYDEENNYVLGSDGVTRLSGCVFADSCTVTSGVINTMKPKTTFHTLDYNDKPEITSWSAPSNKKVDLTFGASEATYTAPANGWFCVYGIVSAGDGYLDVSGKLIAGGQNASETGSIWVSAQAKKGDVVKIRYSNYTNQNFYFRYAEGDK